jgi:hypothetical protein
MVGMILDCSLLMVLEEEGTNLKLILIILVLLLMLSMNSVTKLASLEEEMIMSSQ